MKKEFENIEISESSILGWKVIGDALTLYLEFLLTNLHKEFINFDSDNQFGCYKLGLIKFFGIKNLKGFETKVLLPEWNEKLCEYNDIYEIDTFIFEKSEVKIQSDNSSIIFDYNHYSLNLLESERFEL